MEKGRTGQMETLQLQDEHLRILVTTALLSLAEARQATISDSTLKLYSKSLVLWPTEDVFGVCADIAGKPRREGDTSFPTLGDILERLRERKRKRISENAAQRNGRELEFFFWEHIDFLKSSEGITEQQACDSIRKPGFTGRKARSEREQREAEQAEYKVWARQSEKYKKLHPYLQPGSRSKEWEAAMKAPEQPSTDPCAEQVHSAAIDLDDLPF